MQLKQIGFSVLGLALAACAAPTTLGDDSGKGALSEQLEARAKASREQVPADSQAVMKKAIDDLRASGIAEKAVKRGDQMPAFTLPDIQGQQVSSKELLQKGPLVVVFYRGGWCPYCNLTLRSLQKDYPAFQAQGAELVAIAPEAAGQGRETAQKQSLTFRLLTDADNGFARRLRVVYELPPDLRGVYGAFGLDIPKTNGTQTWELPLAATYVVSRTGEIVYSFLDADYKKRAEPSAVVAVLEGLKGK